MDTCKNKCVVRNLKNDIVIHDSKITIKDKTNGVPFPVVRIYFTVRISKLERYNQISGLMKITVLG